jgi:murein DD-endopeptidase MepM/ murein hydrolase activator NlpD
LIPSQIEKSNKILSVLQKNSRENFILNEMFNDELSPGVAVRKIRASSKLSEESVKLINNTIDLRKQLVEDKYDVELYEQELELKKLELNNQEEYLAVLLSETEIKKDNAEDGIMSEETLLEAQNSLLALMEESGCTGDQVYGVDCAVPPPVVPPVIISNDVVEENSENNANNTIDVNTSGMIRPTINGYVSDEFGERSDYGGVIAKFHNGIDVANACGTPIFAVASGKVVWTGYDTNGGNMVIIVHNIDGQQISSSYAHFQGPAFVSPGQVVSSDTEIGRMGTTGSSTGCHLHLGLSYGPLGAPSSRFNPRQMINFPSLGTKYNNRY